MKSISLLLVFILLPAITVICQPTAASQRLANHQTKKVLWEKSLASHLPFTNIGPTVCSGRVVDVDVNPSNPVEMYIAYASGGLWYTQNNGTSFTPVFDNQVTMTIGDIAVNWSTGTIWVGTGENNSSRSSYAGTGLYKSTDKGHTWKHMGLAESHHIGRIILHPVNDNIIHVACLGALYSKNENRGVYTTSDGGVTWNKTLYINDVTGAIDLVMDANNPNHLYAATWERTRSAWNLQESGEGTGIYKSTDSGRSWELLTTENSGFPHDAGAGRIGLDAVRTKSGLLLYAIIDNQNEREKMAEPSDDLTRKEVNDMSGADFLALPKEKITKFLEDEGFPEKYNTDTIINRMKKGLITPRTLIEYVQNANDRLFETEIIGPEIYVSDDQGKSWKRTHEKYLDNFCYTYGYYFGQIRVAKSNPKKLYILGVPILKSEDGGSTWTSINGDNVHVDHHALWVNPKKEGHLVLGNDGGINISYDDGATWIKCNQPAVGQFYSINVDMSTPYRVFGGLQDNGVWMGPSTYRGGTGWHNTGKYPYTYLMGGDGMQIAIDTRDNNTIYAGTQFGSYARLTADGSKKSKRITPIHALGERPYRWNWETPVHLSVHNQDILYMAAERVFRSFDQGDNFQAISGDLTGGSREGDVAFGTIVSLHESPLTFGLLYAGSDDGRIHVTRDGGREWKRIDEKLPQSYWVSSVQASAHAEGRVYVSLNGYRNDHFAAYVFMSNDFGASWTQLGKDLPNEPVNVIKEDPENPDIVYVGTDNGLYVSIDQGKNFMTLGNLPAVAVHDLVIQERDKELVIATHGRSIYKTDVQHLQQLHHRDLKPLTCFDEELTIRHSDFWGKRGADWMQYNTPSIEFPVFSLSAEPATMEVWLDDLLLYTNSLPVEKGLVYYTYGLQLDSTKATALETKINADQKEGKTIELTMADNETYYLPPGKYKIRIRQSDMVAECSLEIKE